MSKAHTKRKANKDNEDDESEYDKRKRVSQNIADLTQLYDVESPKKAKTNLSSEGGAGSIERIYVKNFKCHSSLEFNLGSNINFILGRNGSGKSAVMDAVILCLGGSSKSTGRQANAKTFIKTNCDKADISITLRNEGPEAYKPHVYGDRIIIERKLTQDTQSNYRILSCDRKMISNKKSEIDNIAQQFNIQVDNPICFLNQEISKHFLNSSDKSQRYKLFMKASQLDTMMQTQEDIERERVNALNLIEEKQSFLPKMEEELFQWEDKYKKCQSVDKLRKRLTHLMQEYTWSVAIEVERSIENLEKEKHVVVKSKEKTEHKLNECKEKQAETTRNFDKVKSILTSLKAQLTQITKERDQLEMEYRRSLTNYKVVQNDVKKLQRQKEIKKQEQQSLETKLNEEKQKTQVNCHEEKRKKEEQIKILKQKISELQAQEKTKYHDSQLFRNEIERESKLQNDCKFNLDHCDRRIRGIKEDIEKFKLSEKNQIAQFGAYMVNLCADIEKEYKKGRFSQMPRGPIGAFIEPVNYDWSLAIEQCIGSLLTSFICANYEDEKTLHQIIAVHCKNKSSRPRVIVNDFQSPIYDVSKYRPSITQYPTVFEMLKIKDNVVANALIDQRKIESVLLLPDRDVGRDVMERNLPKNCSEAFLSTGDQVFGYPSYRFYACNKTQPSIYVKSIQANIDMKLQEIKKIEQDKVYHQNEISKLSVTIKENAKLKATSDSALDALKKELANLNFKLRQTEQIVIEEPVDLAAFEEEIQKINEEIVEIDSNIQRIQGQSAETIKIYKESDEKLKAFDVEVQVKTDEATKYKSEYDQYEDDMTSNQNAIDHYQKLFDKVIKELNEKEAQKRKFQADLENFTQKAQEICDRVETTRTAKAIETEVLQIEKQIELTETLHGNESEITSKYLDMKKRYNNIKNEINKQWLFIKKLKQLIADRNKNTHELLRSKSVRCAVDFQSLISSRDYNGVLQFKHETQQLDIIVHPNKSKNSTDDRDLKSLSGGERSFSTISFLLALWTIVESPILFLDEFDVFMDDLNRQFAVDLILNTAKTKLNGQYVFLTPQDMSFLKPDKQIKIYRMPDPTRAIDMIDENDENERR